jgi:hypothetical protein
MRPIVVSEELFISPNWYEFEFAEAARDYL